LGDHSQLVNGYIIAVKSDKPTPWCLSRSLGWLRLFAPQISVCLRAPLLCRIIVFAIGPALISWHYRPRFDGDAAVLLAVDRGGRECRSLPTAASSKPPGRAILAVTADSSTRANARYLWTSGILDNSGSDFLDSIDVTIPDKTLYLAILSFHLKRSFNRKAYLAKLKLQRCYRRRMQHFFIYFVYNLLKK